MLNKFKYKNWSKNYPTNIIEYLFTPCPLGLRFINMMFQKFFGINRDMKFMVHFSSIVLGQINIGKGVVNSFANSNSCYFQGINGISIGDNTIFAPGVKIISSNHSKEDFSRHVVEKPIKIGKNCWIGVNAVILPGVSLGDNVIVGAGAIVTKSFPDKVTIAGAPAKIIKQSFIR